MRAWRLAIIVLGTLILCSCRGPASHAPNQAAAPSAAAAPGGYAALPPQAYTGMPPGEPCPVGPPGMEGGVPLPYTAAGPWTPPGIIPPWPSDEYLRDGGNAGPPVRVGPNGELLGLEMEDTVARYNTLDGRTLVEPSNKVSLYSPRFNAVRQVVDVEIDQQRNRATGVAEPVKPLVPRTSEPVGLNTQNLQAVRDIGDEPGRATPQPPVAGHALCRVAAQGLRQLLSRLREPCGHPHRRLCRPRRGDPGQGHAGGHCLEPQAGRADLSGQPGRRRHGGQPEAARDLRRSARRPIRGCG